MAHLALVVALGGTSYAAVQIPNDSVTTAAAGIDCRSGGWSPVGHADSGWSVELAGG